ncbi:MAG: hypothetical protein ACFNUU_04960, partial [Campylobacter sp.]|uniref:hypothetical protein n=1 Tax=Campylobacter sp. TaxID=205 RepID=UPI00361DE313
FGFIVNLKTCRVIAPDKPAHSAATHHVVGVGGFVKGEGSSFASALPHNCKQSIIQAPSLLKRKIKLRKNSN